MDKESFLTLLRDNLQADTEWNLYKIFDEQWNPRSDFDLKKFAESIREQIRLKSLEYSVPQSEDYEKYWESACQRVLEKQDLEELFSVLKSMDESDLLSNMELESIYELDTKSELKTVLAMLETKKIKETLRVFH
jgi:hypothetical protein